MEKIYRIVSNEEGCQFPVGTRVNIITTALSGGLKHLVAQTWDVNENETWWVEPSEIEEV